MAIPVNPENNSNKKFEIEQFAKEQGVDLTGFKFNREELYNRGLS